ncbi:hypothetical protein HNR39_001868 [Glaciimonas immobilis]|uniref:Uncharacterized protein n=1 Tax=Glaciimonas immobilis TaxID=728004 RepID=A0A840RSV3_9BURK|nr:hypothetical protein [Glaciimonas immobilis]
MRPVDQKKESHPPMFNTGTNSRYQKNRNSDLTAPSSSKRLGAMTYSSHFIKRGSQALTYSLPKPNLNPFDKQAEIA